MIKELITSMLGPSGMRILDWYVDNNLVVNGAVVLIAIGYLFFPRIGKGITNWLLDLYHRSPFAPDEKDRRAIEEYKAKAKGKRMRRNE